MVYGNPETTPGGRALKFYSSVRLEVRRKGDVKNGIEKIGNRVRVKVTKNKVAPPFKEAEIDLMFGRGIDKQGDLIQIATDLDVIQKSGSWYSINGERLGQGKEKTVEALNEQPDLLANIREQVLKIVRPKPNDQPDSPRTTTNKLDQAIQEEVFS